MARLWLPYASRHRVAIAKEIEIEQEIEQEKEKIIVLTFIKNNTN